MAILYLCATKKSKSFDQSPYRTVQQERCTTDVVRLRVCHCPTSHEIFAYTCLRISGLVDLHVEEAQKIAGQAPANIQWAFCELADGWTNGRISSGRSKNTNWKSAEPSGHHWSGQKQSKMPTMCENGELRCVEKLDGERVLV